MLLLTNDSLKDMRFILLNLLKKNGKIKYGVSVSNQWKIAQFKGVTSKLSSRNVA